MISDRVTFRARPPSGPFMDRFVHSLREAQSLVAVARTVFAEAVRALGASGATLELYTAGGSPIVCATSLPRDESRLASYMRGGHKRDPCVRAVRTSWTTVASLDVDPAGDDELVGPIIGDGALLGALRFGIVTPPTQELRRRLGAICTHVSVRLAELGFSSPLSESFARLTRRQREVVHLTTRGFTTQQMAGVLAISPNTVKKHLKLVFARLHVQSRVALTAQVSRYAARVDQLDELRADGVTVRWMDEGDDADADAADDDDEPATATCRQRRQSQASASSRLLGEPAA
ncbi:MAG TPA: helix-turn-helix domain-containing protein [Kofleriaceae bacterium]|nr:helix-turn-helix domain-containing protein [Kofleriaceae bacterium]